MAEQIRQELGFDATQAISTLRQLDNVMKAFNNTVGTTLRTLDGFNKKSGKTVRAFKQINNSANTAATSMKTVRTAAAEAGSSAEEAGKKGEKAAKSWTISWQTLTRVVATQAIVRALNVVRQSLSAAIGDAVKFQRSVAEIKTISSDNLGLDTIADLARRVSDEFNVGLGDSAEAIYQALSNQIAQTEKQLESFTGSAAKFSKITKTDLATSVNLLSGTLNAFGLQVADTEEVAAKFFNTIKLGRTRAEELAQGYGTVAPIAKTLGVAFDELNASIATLTISGIQTDKAFTQIRGVMQSFLKPTEEMKDAMRELGFSTGEQILEAFNLQDALKAVIGTTDGSAASVAKLVPRIRGLTGAISLANDDAGRFTTSINEQKTALEDAYGQAFQVVVETDAEKVTKELNRLKNFFTVEFGQAVLDAGVKMFEFIGGASTLITIFQSIAASLPTILAGFAAFGVALGVLHIGSLVLAGGLTTAATAATQLQIALGVIGLAAGAILAVNFLFKTLEKNRAEELASSLKANDEAVEARKQKIEKELRAEKEKLEELKKFHAQEVANSRKLYLAEVDAIRKDDDVVVSNTKWALGEVVRSREAAVNAIGAASKGMSKSIDDARRSAIDLRADLDRLLFQRKLKGKGENEQFRKLTTAAAMAAKEAVDLMNAAVTDVDRKAAQEAHKRALALNEQAFSLDLVTKSQFRQNKVNSQARVITGNFTKAMEDNADVLVDNRKSLAESSRAAAAALVDLKKREASLLDLTSVFDKAGKPLDPEQVIANRKRFESELAGFLAAAEGFSDKIGIEGSEIAKKLVEKITFDRDAVEVQTLIETPDNIGAVYNQIDAAFQRLAQSDPIIVEIQAFAKLQGLDITDAASLENVQRQFAEGAATSKEQIAASNIQLGVRNNLLTDTGVLLEDIKKFEPAPFTGFLNRSAKEWNALNTEIATMTREGPVSIESVNEIGERLNTFVENLGLLQRKLTFPVEDINKMVQALDNLGEAANIANVDLQANDLSPFADPESAKFQTALKLDALYDQRTLKLQAEKTLTEQTTSAQKVQAEAVKATDTAVQNLAASYGRVVAVARQAASAQAVAAQGLPGAIKNPFFASGGIARGTDTINAVLSKGETVTNAKSSRRFFSQLQAINAGQRPVYRSAGGDTYSTTVGDINIQAADRPQQTARETMALIRREERRGSGRL